MINTHDNINNIELNLSENILGTTPVSSASIACPGHSNPRLPGLSTTCGALSEACPSCSTNCDIIYEKIKRKKQTIQIIICDNNNHILPHIKEHLFESFNSTSGSGLGLYICKSIVELHGGTIIHEYISPIGNKFIITLPLAVYEKNII